MTSQWGRPNSSKWRYPFTQFREKPLSTHQRSGKRTPGGLVIMSRIYIYIFFSNTHTHIWMGNLMITHIWPRSRRPCHDVFSENVLFKHSPAIDEPPTQHPSTQGQKWENGITGFHQDSYGETRGYWLQLKVTAAFCSTDRWHRWKIRIMTCSVMERSTIFTLWLFNIAMGNGPFIDGLPIKNGDFPWLC